MLKRNKLSYERKKSFYGFMFIVPWLIGFTLFFLQPLIQSIWFSFSKVNITDTGFATEFVKLENYRYIFFDSAKYVDNLTDAIGSFVYQIPIIFILSYIIAVVLNSKFKGRMFFRSVFFVPVIISTGVVMQYITGDAVMEGMRSSAGSGGSVYLSGLIDFNKVFTDLGLPNVVTSVINDYVDDIFNLIWNCGIQIVLFVSGLQAIPEQLYEVSKVEGATKWEEFWYITTPMLRGTINLVLIFTVIDFCASNSNSVMRQAYTLLLEQQNYSQSSAIMWAFFAVVAVIFGVVLWLINRCIFKKWE